MYSIEAVNLVASCVGYDPQHILAWYPQYEGFGRFDGDHAKAWRFRRGWSAIAQDPLRHVDGWQAHASKAVSFLPVWEKGLYRAFETQDGDPDDVALERVCQICREHGLRPRTAKDSRGHMIWA